jgi:hypothetical protein
MCEAIWSKPEIVTWTQVVLNSYHRLMGEELIEREAKAIALGAGDAIEQSKTLYLAPFALVSHGTETDPILNYGNQTALKLWEMSWEVLTKTPSRLTAEPMNREERQQMLMQVNERGFIDNYRGVRISSTGKRFYLKKAIVWNLTDSAGKHCGQAATFSEWDYLS